MVLSGVGLQCDDLEIRCEVHKLKLTTFIIEVSPGKRLIEVQPCPKCLFEHEDKARIKLEDEIDYHLNSIRECFNDSTTRPFL